MDTPMFCFQCEQTARHVGCAGARGVCGKMADTADLQDDLTGAKHRTMPYAAMPYPAAIQQALPRVCCARCLLPAP